MYIARHNVTINRSVFPWRKPPPSDPNEPQHPMLLGCNNTLESMDESDTNIVNPEYVVQLELANDKDDDGDEVRSIITCNWSAHRPIETLDSMYCREREERQTLADATNLDDRLTKATRLPEQPQRVHEHLQSESENCFTEQ
eukprot:3415448-Rhodomonas_salina.1